MTRTFTLAWCGFIAAACNEDARTAAPDGLADASDATHDTAVVESTATPTAPETASDGTPDGTPESTPDEATPEVVTHTVRTALPADLLAFRDTLLADAAAFARADGAWTEDQGDAAYYGTALYAHLAAEGTGPADASTIAEASFAYNVGVLEHALDDVPWLLDNLEECMMSALGVIEVLDLGPRADGQAKLDAFLDLLDSMLAGFGDYLEVDVNSWALRTYGPTAITGAVALLHVQYAMLVGGDRGPERLERARAMLATVDAKAWNGSFYKFSLAEERLDLYPNMMMALVLGRLYQHDGDVAAKTRAEALFEAIQPLRLPAGNYYSQYSAVLMGAKTTDYSTLSSQNYLVMVLAVLYENASREDARAARYLNELVSVLGFIKTHLYDAAQHRVLHHWIDGEIARPTDPEVFCAGCNLQLLYIYWYITRERIVPG